MTMTDERKENNNKFIDLCYVMSCYVTYTYIHACIFSFTVILITNYKVTRLNI